MSEYSALISWNKTSHELFTDNKYSRAHEWTFDGGITVPASAPPNIVPLPYSIEANIDPEEAFVASVSSCHMLIFLSLAAKQRFVVESYIDHAIGKLEPSIDGKLWMSLITLDPKVQFTPDKVPSIKQLEKMHHQAHEQCFIANSIKTKVITNISK